jgi:hypothetical protein
MLNRYFILTVPNENMTQIYDLIIGDESTQRYSLDGSKIVIKLPVGDNENHGILQNAIEYTHEQIRLEMAGPEWTEAED